MQTAENKLIFENKYDIIILLSGAHPHTGQAKGEGDILRDGKQPKNDLETTKAFNPGTSPIQKLKKRKRLILKPPVRGCGAERERFLLLMFRTWMITAGSRATAALADGL